MALNMTTDPHFDEALKWLAEKEKKTKSDIIREMVLERYQAKKAGFRFGALSLYFAKEKNREQQIQKELKEMDKDHDLD